MTETERNQIKGALLKCAEENENQFTLTGHIVISSLCKSAVERIAELEKENAELKAFKQNCIKLTEDNVVMAKQRGETVIQLTKAKEIIKKLHDIVCGKSGDDWELIEEAEQFIKGQIMFEKKTKEDSEVENDF